MDSTKHKKCPSKGKLYWEKAQITKSEFKHFLKDNDFTYHCLNVCSFQLRILKLDWGIIDFYPIGMKVYIIRLNEWVKLDKERWREQIQDIVDEELFRLELPDFNKY